VAEWLRSGLQIRALRFDSGRGLQLPQKCSGITFAAHRARRPRLVLHALWPAYIHVRHINGDQLMDEFRNARLAMIDSQLRPSGVAEARLLRAFAEVPREKFVSENRRAVAYVDDLQPVGGQGRFILSPAHFGRMAQLAKVESGDRVLDLGAASGYSTAILASLADEVIGLEFDSSLALAAAENLKSLAIKNAEVVAGDLESVSGKSFDVILVEGGLHGEPTDLIAMLRDGGRLVAPVFRNGVALVCVYRRGPNGVMFTSEFDATMPELRNSALKQEFVF
jgi:protein-L-isoaspartate(D-aspartate) O-methyltransferase